MKKIKLKRPVILATSALLMTIIIWSCKKDFEEESSLKVFQADNQAFELIYETEVVTMFDLEEDEEYPDIDIAAMTPSKESHRTLMQIDSRGNVSMELTKLDVKDPIVIDGPGFYNPTDGIKKTVVRNSMATSYCNRGEIVSSSKVEMPMQREFIQQLKNASLENPEIVDEIAVSGLLGRAYFGTYEEFAANRSSAGATMNEVSENLITVREAYNDNDPATRIEIVTLINRSSNKIVGVRIYDKDTVVITSMYAYDGDDRNSRIVAINSKSLEVLPSGKEVYKSTITRFNNIKHKINL